MTNQTFYCTLFNTQISNYSGFKISAVDVNRYLFDLTKAQTLISRQIAIKLNATLKELAQLQMTIEIVLNTDSVSFEAKIDQGGIPAIPESTRVKVGIGSESEMRVFDLIIGKDAIFQAKVSAELWQKQIDDYKNKKMSEDIFEL